MRKCADEPGHFSLSKKKLRTAHGAVRSRLVQIGFLMCDDEFFDVYFTIGDQAVDVHTVGEESPVKIDAVFRTPLRRCIEELLDFYQEIS